MFLALPEGKKYLLNFYQNVPPPPLLGYILKRKIKLTQNLFQMQFINDLAELAHILGKRKIE